MDNRVRVAVGLLGAVLVLSLLVLFVGLDEFISSISSADPLLAASAIVCAFLWLSAWTGSFYVVTNYLKIDFSYLDSIRTYSTVMFANNVTPFAHLGGEPIAAGFISKIVKEDYEKCLAALSAISTIHFIPSLLFFTLGSFYILATGAGIPDSLDNLMFAFLILTMGIVAAIYLLLNFKDGLQYNISNLLIWVSNLLSRIPKIPSYEPDEIRTKVAGYFSEFFKVATNKRVIFLAGLASTTGVFLQSLGLWLALQAVGTNVPLVLTILAVPIAGLASALPLPGGAGGIEAVLITIIVALSQNPVPEVTAGVILMRGAIYWTPIVLGAINIGVLSGIIDE